MRLLFTLLLILSFSLPLFSGDSQPVKKTKDYIADLESSNKEDVIIIAANKLGKEKEKDAIPKLIKLLTDERDNIRLHVAIALGYIGDESAAEDLNKIFLNDTNSEVRYAAILSSFRIGSKKSYKAWEEAKEKESDPFIKDILQKLFEKYKGK